MGYQRPTLKLVFADPEFDGLEVRARRLTVGAMLRLHKLSATQAASPDGDDSAERFGELLSAVADSIISWNLEDDQGQPVPATAAGLRSQDMPLVEAVKQALLDASVGVAPPLPQPSSGGGPSPEESIPMDPL